MHKLFKGFDEFKKPEKDFIRRRQNIVDLFFLNPYMNSEIKAFRARYGMPEAGFDRQDRGDISDFHKWESGMYERYSEHWQDPPQELIEMQRDWEQLSEEEKDGAVEPIETWEPDCYINIKVFQEEMRLIYDKYSKKIHLDDYGVFERYVLTNRIPHIVSTSIAGDQWIVDDPRLLEEVISQERGSNNKITRTVVRCRLPRTAFLEGQPDLLVGRTGKEVTSICIEIKPDTNIENIRLIWRSVESYQQKMKGYRSRIKEHPNMARNLELFDLIKIQRNTYGDAIIKWNDEHPGAELDVNDSAIQHAIERLEKQFKPEDI
jgi:hypothetical protein